MGGVSTVLLSFSRAARHDVYSEVRLGRLFQVFLDGIPLDLTSRLFPYRTRLRPALLVHLHLHARSDRTVRARGAVVPRSATTVSRTAHRGLIDSLTSGIRGLSWDPRGTEWADYYEDTNYTAAAMAHKEELVRGFIERVRPRQCGISGPILGASAGSPPIPGREPSRSILIPRLPSSIIVRPRRPDRRGAPTRHGSQQPDTRPRLGRPRADVAPGARARRSVMTLALVHHLAISNNVPLKRVAEFLASIGRALSSSSCPSATPRERSCSPRARTSSRTTPRVHSSVLSHHFSISLRSRLFENPSARLSHDHQKLLAARRPQGRYAFRADRRIAHRRRGATRWHAACRKPLSRTTQRRSQGIHVRSTGTRGITGATHWCWRRRRAVHLPASLITGESAS